jgi:hypothetical protein
LARITLNQVKAWAEPTKFSIVALDTDLLAHMEEEVLDRLRSVEGTDVDSWVDASTTPVLVQTIISKKYFAILYSRQYSEDNGPKENVYAAKVDANAEMLILGILAGTIVIPGTVTSPNTSPGYYPTDVSSAQDPTDDDMSLGPAKFSMNQVF